MVLFWGACSKARRELDGKVLVELGEHRENPSAKEELCCAEQSAMRGSLCLSSQWQTRLSCLYLVTG